MAEAKDVWIHTSQATRAVDLHQVPILFTSTLYMYSLTPWIDSIMWHSAQEGHAGM